LIAHNGAAGLSPCSTLLAEPCCPPCALSDTFGFRQTNRLITVSLEAQDAKNLNRPGMERLFSLVNEGKVQTVIIAKLDRLTRSVKDLAELLERFQWRGVSLCFSGRVARYWIGGWSARDQYNDGGEPVGTGGDCGTRSRTATPWGISPMGTGSARTVSTLSPIPRNKWFSRRSGSCELGGVRCAGLQ
jgi:hypothetical protein